jgi:dTMP kinase
MDMEWCKKAETGLPKPDVVFFLSLSPEALSKRGGFGTERYEVTEMQREVRNNFSRLEDDSWQVFTSFK